MLGEYEIIKCVPLLDYKLDLTFADGKNGIVDLRYLVGKAVFTKWNDYEEFSKVSINTVTKTLSWTDDIDIDPISLKNKIITYLSKNTPPL